MKIKLLLSVLLLFIGQAGFGQETPSGKTIENSSANLEKGLTKVSVMYPFEEGKTFNMEYYETKHMPMVAGFLGSNLVRYTIEKGVASGMPNSQLPFMAIGTFYIKDLGEYQAAIGPNRDAIRADFPNYTNVTPVILVSEIIK